MAETPEGPPEQRLPVPRPPVEPAPVERFTSPPQARSFELTPERAAQVVRQSANARWVGFLIVVIVALFIAVYWFYELGPLGISEPRLDAETNAQQVTAVERGYNLFEANCARCHGAQGEGGVGPTLNRQDKLFAHLNENYLRQVLNAGGRYVCGNPNSLMPVWSNTANPPGPLNYVQIDDLIAFIRATNDKTYEVRDPTSNEPVHDPITGQIETFKGWVDPNYKPAAGATPYPDCWTAEFASGSASPSGSPSASGSAAPPGSAAPSGSPAASASAGAGGQPVSVVAQGIAFTTADVTAPADTTFVIAFDNEDAGTPHNIEIKDSAGTSVFKGEIFPGVATKNYDVPALKAGTYSFACDVHPYMTGTLTAK
jgi:mono/diheme cytochrome c family protein/plastocyanin